MKKAPLLASNCATLCSGITEAAIPVITESLIDSHKAPLTFLIGEHLKKVEQWAEDIAFFHKLFKRETLLEVATLPGWTTEIGEDSRTFEFECDQLDILTRLLNKDPEKQRSLVIVTTPQGLLQPAPSPKWLKTNRIYIQVGQSYPFGLFVEHLTQSLGYDSEALCEKPGQFAIRGGIIDIYPLNTNVPFRIDFFGDKVETLRELDPTTQRSGASMDTLTIAPNPKSKDVQEGMIFQYMDTKTLWILQEPNVLITDNPDLFCTEKKVAPQLNYQKLFIQREKYDDSYYGLTELDTGETALGHNVKRYTYKTEPLTNYRRFSSNEQLGLERITAEQASRLEFLKQVKTWQQQGYTIYFVFKNKSESNRIRTILNDEPDLKGLNPHFIEGPLNEGFRINHIEDSHRIRFSPTKNTSGLIVATDSEILGRRHRRITPLRKRSTPTLSPVNQLLDFSELAEGDFVVHLQHGICIYRGLGKIDLEDQQQEVISLEFEEGILLHLPLQQSHLISRYIGLSKRRPKLSRLGGNTWKKTRRAAEAATLDFAAQLLQLQARRTLLEGHAFGPDHPWQKDFEDDFIHSETQDQLAAIKAVKADMEAIRPMERLICGDVGFGKTEIILRAAFKAVLDGKQVAILTPTTVLAQQHFNTFQERMREYAVAVEMISRFRTPQQQKKILHMLKEGGIDILIGTHRLLSSDITFKDLGLLVIDEEHRFGVRQKERLKQLRQAVDVLTLSATPIPRSLYLALTGTRSMSVIETPPTDRLPIQTVVRNYSPEVIKDAIQFEINRGGQVFYLHNRIGTIQTIAEQLRELIPGIRVALGHGQMAEEELEEIMTRFVAGEYDVLVSTTIIESGLDIPNSNTIIIESADRFGLSQLYQLRGRVGRFKRQAYAYLLLKPHSAPHNIARKRLAAIKQYNQLGAGFQLAMRDLELRGAGNLLGAQQSGHVAGVGFELYCQLLRQSVARIKGERIAHPVHTQLSIDFVIWGETDLPLSGDTPDKRLTQAVDVPSLTESTNTIAAYLPYTYISEARLRVDFYRQLALANTPTEVHAIKEALEDRFGTCSEPVQALLTLSEIRCLAQDKGIDNIEVKKNILKCRYSGASPKYMKSGTQFPRLTNDSPLLKLNEIKQYLTSDYPGSG